MRRLIIEVFFAVVSCNASKPVRILKQWRLWVVNGRVVTQSLRKEGAGVVYRTEIDDLALGFARPLVNLNPGQAQAYVVDNCHIENRSGMLETNCISAAGVYVAGLMRQVDAIEELSGK